ncbi:TerD family protein [Streptomyces polygonati]|uniref:TerD family protein n=1 Tax=Streptomyces polygonati TaxID=1617087 RepID=A0ABV8HHR8_9ACTN
MTAELVRGQNHPLPGNRLEIRVSAGTPVVAAVTLGDERGRVIGDPEGAAKPEAAGSPPDSASGWLAHPGRPRLPGVEVPRRAAADHRLALDLGALPPEAHRVHVLLVLPTARPGAPADFGAAPAPHLTVTTSDGAPVTGFTITGLGAETALLALELYRRGDGWKVRAVGQGYAEGLAALLLDQGVPDAVAVAGEVQAAAGREQSRPAPPPDRDTSAGAAAAPAPSAASGPPTVAGRTGGASEGAPDPAAASSAASGAAGATGVDYRHPRRRGAAEPPLPTTPSTAAPAPTPAGGRHQPRPSAALPPQAPPPPEAAAGSPAGQEDGGGGPPAPVAGDASGWTMDERLHNQIWSMFEDLARSVAAYRSAADFAQSRYDQELDRLLADPRTRGGPAAESARDEAELRQAALVDRARAVLDRDLAQLAAEAEVVEPALPPPFAGWENPVWHAYQVPAEPPMAVRLGSLTLPEAPELRIPLLARLPLERGLWIDSADNHALAMETAVAVAARLLASYPVGCFAVHALDPAGSGSAPLAPLSTSHALVLPPPAAGAAGVNETLARLTERVDLLQMAMRGGAPDALPPGFDPAEQLLIVNEFPYGFDDRALTRLRYLADEGPGVGVHLLLVADREDADEYGPVLDPLWRSLLRLTPLPSDHLADPWVGHAWTYEPAMVPPDSQVLTRVLRQLAAARPAFGP